MYFEQLAYACSTLTTRVSAWRLTMPLIRALCLVLQEARQRLRHVGADQFGVTAGELLSAGASLHRAFALVIGGRSHALD